MSRLKSSFPWSKGLYKASRLSIALAGVTTLAACTSHVSDDLSVDALGKSGDAIIMMAVTLDRLTEINCISANLRTTDGKVPLTSQGNRVLSIKLGSGTIIDATTEVIGSTQISPGTYKIDHVTCNSPTGNGSLDVMSANLNGFATFTVSAGEVVNLGKLVVLEVEAQPGTIWQPPRYAYVGQISPLKSDPRTQLNKDLATRLIDRPMTSSNAPLPKAELVRICEQKRAKAASGIALVKLNPISCAMAGI